MTGAYVHVPFCESRCAYCSFATQEGLSGESAYFEALAEEMRSRRDEADGALETVYLGGGTPSFVPVERVAASLRSLRDLFGIADGAEVTLEGNPDDLDRDRLESLHEAGVTRLSVGVQSLSDAELALLGRRHDAARARSALSDAARLFGNVSADLLIGIPGQGRQSLLASLDGLLESGVSHLSAYLLEIEKAPRLLALRSASPELFAPDEELAERWELVDDRLAGAGWPRYEMSNWARPGFESRHNLKYWMREPVLGFGSAAHSFDGAVRSANAGTVPEYVSRIAREGRATIFSARVEGNEALLEGAMLGLRLAGGIHEEALGEAAALLTADDRLRLAECEEAGLLERRGGRVRLTRRGVLLSNEVFALLV